MKKWIVVVLAAAMVSSCMCGCEALVLGALYKDHFSGSESGEKHEEYEEDEEDEEYYYDEPEINFTTMLDTMKDGDTIPLTEADVYLELFDDDLITAGVQNNEEISINEDCSLGKKGHNIQHFYNSAHAEEATIYYRNDETYSEKNVIAKTYVNYNLKKMYFYDPEYGKFFSIDQEKGSDPYYYRFFPENKDTQLTVDEGFFVCSEERDNDEWKYRYTWDNMDVRCIVEKNDILIYDVTVSTGLSNYGIDEYIAQNECGFIVFEQEIMAPDFEFRENGGPGDVYRLIDKSMKEYWETASPVIKE